VFKTRIRGLQRREAESQIDVVALVPGPSLLYLTGLSFFVSERPVIALFAADGPISIVLPALESVKLDDVELPVQVLPYTDGEGYGGACREAFAPFSNCTIGVEESRMRLLEARALEHGALDCRLEGVDGLLTEIRVPKDEGEICQIRAAVDVTEAALRSTVSQIQLGITEREVAALFQIEVLKAGGDGLAFAPIVASGANAASPHATPSHRAIGEGETILVDCGATVGGYAADITRTFVLGDLEGVLARAYETVLEANRAGLAASGPGVAAQDVDRAVRSVITQAGFGAAFTHRTGHGIGLDIHEPPFIVEGNHQVLREGMTYTIEPGVYLPGVGGVRIEDDVVITRNGAECLTSFQRDPHLPTGGA
jgi:Xaa-Pro dipeptidase